MALTHSHGRPSAHLQAPLPRSELECGFSTCERHCRQLPVPGEPRATLPVQDIHRSPEETRGRCSAQQHGEGELGFKLPSVHLNAFKM